MFEMVNIVMSCILVKGLKCFGDGFLIVGIKEPAMVFAFDGPTASFRKCTIYV